MPTLSLQGLTRAGPVVEENSLVTGLWVHETLRVFYDRLINDDDRTWLTGLLSGTYSTRASSMVMIIHGSLACCQAHTQHTLPAIAL